MVAMIQDATVRSRRPTTASVARVATLGALTLDEESLIDALMVRLYGVGLEPVGLGPADALVVGRGGLADAMAHAGDLERAHPRRVVVATPASDVDVRRWHELLPDAHVLILDLDAVRRFGVEESARRAHVSLAACWAVSPAAGPLPLLPRPPDA